MEQQTIYLLDANTLIDAKRDYFEFDRVPEFWDWLQHQGSEGRVKIPLEIYEEFEEARNKDGERDSLAEWAENVEVRNVLRLGEETNPMLIQRVISQGYVANPTDQDIERMGRDPFLIAYALSDPTRRVVVTTEVSSPSRKGANRKVPDVCAGFGIRCINSFQLLRELNFRTGWRG